MSVYVSRGRAMLAALALIGFMLGGCGDGGSGGGDNASEPASASADHQQIDDSTSGEIRSYLVDEAEAEVRDESADRATVVVTLPTENESTTEYQIEPGVDLPAETPTDPAAPVLAFSVSADEANGGLEWSYEYIVPASAFPDGALAARREAGESLVADLGRDGFALAPLLQSGNSGVKVIAHGELKEFTKEGLGHLEEAVSGSDAVATELADSAMNVAEAAGKGAAYWSMLDRLDAMRACAENPTSALTKKQYQEDPAAKQHVLDEIESVRREIRTNTAVQFIGALNSQAAGLTGQAWLGFVIGPAISWADSQLASINQEDMQRLEDLVPKCAGYREFLGGYTSPYGNNPRLDVAGVACTEDIHGEWAVLSSGNPQVRVTQHDLDAIAAGAGPEQSLPVYRTEPGIGFDVAGESPFVGVITIVNEDTIHLKVLDRYHDDRVVDEVDLPLEDIETNGNFCGRLVRNDTPVK